jgi:SAM-dependent methyltransferase
MIAPDRSIQIDEEGYFSFDGIRVTDEAYGRELLDNVFVDDMGRYLCRAKEFEVRVEPFDEPLIAVNVEKLQGLDWELILPYGAKQNFNLKTLSLDEWDRFHGRTHNGVPFVFSRAAQATFFNLLDDYDDESITVAGTRIEPDPWLLPNTNARNEKFWNGIYSSEKPAWELGEPHQALPTAVPQLKLTRSRILVLGAGSGNDAAYFAREGHIVTAVDFSHEAVAQAKTKYAALANLKFVQADALNLPPEFTQAFDIVFEHTLYCALDPQNRNDLVKTWRSALAPRGNLLAIFEVFDKRTGPPWGGSEWEVRSRLQKYFRALYWTRLKQGPERRIGRELLYYGQRLN